MIIEARLGVEPSNYSFAGCIVQAGTKRAISSERETREVKYPSALRVVYLASQLEQVVPLLADGQEEPGADGVNIVVVPVPEPGAGPAVRHAPVRLHDLRARNPGSFQDALSFFLRQFYLHYALRFLDTRGCAWEPCGTYLGFSRTHAC